MSLLALFVLLGFIQISYQIDCLGDMYNQLKQRNSTLEIRIEIMNNLLAIHSPVIQRMHYKDYNPYQFAEMTKVGSKTFLLSRHKVNNVFLADQVCAIYGGFLAEIENFSEYTAAMDVVSKNFQHYKCVWVGANDETFEGRFIYTHSKGPAYTLWAPGEPNMGRKENCVAIYPGNGDTKGKMYDAPCEHHEPCQFLCQLA